MSRDYIKLSKGSVEARGRYVLHAIYGYLAFQLIGRLCLLAFVLVAAASGSASFLKLIIPGWW